MLRGIGQQVLKSQEKSYSTSANVRSNRLPKLFLGGLLVGGTGYTGWTYYNSGPKALDMDRYVPLKLIKKDQISRDSYLLRLSTKQQQLEYPVPSCLYIKDDTIQVMRPYTPINENPYKDGYIDLVVKRYDNGSVSRTLSGFELNEDVHVRGPMMEEYEYKENTCDEIGMIAGGTGISPMYQLICRILENPNDQKTHIWLIYGNKKIDDILLKSELDKLVEKHADRFKVKYVLEEPPSEDYERGYITKEIIQDMMMNERRRKIFVCGPNALLNLVCGERARDYSQGQVTGILSHLGLSSNEIWKFQ